MDISSLLFSIVSRLFRAVSKMGAPPDPALLASLRGDSTSGAIEDQMIEELRRRAAVDFAVDHLAPKPATVGWGMALMLNSQWILWWLLAIRDWWLLTVFVLLSILSAAWIIAMVGATSVMSARRKWLVEKADCTAPTSEDFRTEFQNYVNGQPQWLARLMRRIRRPSTTSYISDTANAHQGNPLEA